ncbi:MAG: hypothetical protein A3D92_14850 [Bacteroidetes bacterium RIFCSPHIGHO2_02_FULL_44_7]|nr:MAG: hypothetical protein A3D92_14850 [Bacteroidetes bacterium RIFCSPHIGHO2_02_FULL_44_7]OGX08127.1 MAG: hypothetical protein A2Z88_02085 [Omnitrophica WOR_2 bacterium GWA2_47_8]
MAESPFKVEARDKSQDPLKKKTLWQSQEIFGEAKMVMIQHQETIYRLMITRQGKLILTK